MNHFQPFTIVLLIWLLAGCGAQGRFQEIARHDMTPTVAQSQNGATSERHGNEEKTGQEPSLGMASDVLPALTPRTSQDNRPLRLLASTSLVGDVVKAVAGDLATVDVLLPPGVDPHNFSPTPGDARLVADADVIIINGLGLEQWIEQLLELDQNAQRPVVPLSAGIAPRRGNAEDHHEEEAHPEAEDAEEHAEDEAHAEDEDHAHDGVDPHVWFNPQHVIQWAENAATVLSAIDPANAERYRENAQRYQQELEALDEALAAQAATIPEAQRQLITNHDNLGYLADRYGFTVIGAIIPSISADAEPSAAEMAALTERIRAYKAPAIFVENTVSPRLAETIAQETGAQVVPLYTDALGPAGSGAESYLGLMRVNMDRIVAALR